MKKIVIAASSCLLAFGLVSCSTNTTRENTGIGAVSGAVVGGLAGSAIGGSASGAAIAIGAVAGAIVGAAIGESMDSSDKNHMATFSHSLKSSQSTSWVNTKTGIMYTFTPLHSVRHEGYSYCRKYKVTASYPSHKVKRYYGVACRQSNGTWAVVK